MAKAKNRVIAGDYTGMVVGAAAFTPYIITGFVKSFNLDKQTVESYEVITDEHRKSAASGVARGIVGGVLLGPVGMLAGGLSAKSKGIYQIALNFKDGKRSLIEVDDKIYKAIVKSCF
ncbi:hypothetical protein J4O15_03960 [Lachnoanaerobaculum sp. Marseille-Q4761]|uniref:hypothetical protein n=1 Tax=Lachnoanaerobaculum sp. Marseille-Q4761 TaxID=2819511 RepID=UPI001AA1A596|nr:hypothetical protein [Lachnoanaerobaculum sp. Marseille-Q4761]MBO1870114.1 hypothetical protein [Lachnoanaerobaculum sp. Marseille-Q4761]